MTGLESLQFQVLAVAESDWSGQPLRQTKSEKNINMVLRRTADRLFLPSNLDKTERST